MGSLPSRRSIKGDEIKSGGLTRGRKCYATPTFLGVPIKGDRVKSGHITPAFSGPQEGGSAT